LKWFVMLAVQQDGTCPCFFPFQQDILKLGDFGSCCSVYSKQPYTEYISTRWYRAPECLLTDGFYTYKMDLWSAGCVFYEIAR
jgi:renal tumor antigen